MSICSLDEPELDESKGRRASVNPIVELARLRNELNETKTELQTALRRHEISCEEQNLINAEARAAIEEYQSKNEELMNCNGELQNINKTLMEFNARIQEALEEQLTKSNDLRDVLCSTDVATILLDTNLNIRFFTPSIRCVFKVIPSDIGRPIADLHSQAIDDVLLFDARTTLQTLVSTEKEIRTEGGDWYIRRTFPYRARDNAVEGVVVIFADMTEPKRAASAVEAALLLAEQANIAKSRFLLEASQNLRQQLQTFSLIQGLLAKAVKIEAKEQLIGKLNMTIRTMSGFLKPLLDLSRIEAESVDPHLMNVPINDILARLSNEYAPQARDFGLAFRVVNSKQIARTDPRLLEQILYNLLANAFTYTTRGKVLLGCRRRGDALHIEIWDTGSGIPDTQLGAIFEEHQQFENSAPQRSRGIGLGLSNVRRWGALLNHRISVHSIPGKGSVFAVEVKLSTASTISPPKYLPRRVEGVTVEPDRSAGLILVIMGDSGERELLGLLLEREKYFVATAGDSVAAMELIARAETQPDLIVVDDDLPNGSSGFEVLRTMRQVLHQKIPTIILTNGISTTAFGNGSRRDHVHLRKPVRPDEMIDAVRSLLSARAALGSALVRRTSVPSRQAPPKIFVVVHDADTRDELCSVLEDDIATVQAYATAEAFLEAYRPGREACLVIDAFLPRMSGLELVRRLDEAGGDYPAILISDKGDVPTAVQAIKAGAWDIVEKPIVHRDLIASVHRALGQSSDLNKQAASRKAAVQHFANLTLREREIMKKVLAGVSNKNIAADLCISQRTVENHRASVMKKTGSTSLPVLARLALAAEWIGADERSSRPLLRHMTEAGK